MKRAAGKMAESSAKVTSGSSSCKKAAQNPKKRAKKKAEAAAEEEGKASESDYGDDENGVGGDIGKEEMGGPSEFHAEW